jgi:predicted O-methyltransferase YrrM
MSRNSKILKRLLTNRPHKFGAEIGVFEGATSRELLRGLPGLERLVCVDIWEPDEEFLLHTPNKKGRVYNADWSKVRKKFAEEVLKPYDGRVMPLQMLSEHAAELFTEGAFHFIFIDANHGYEFVKSDIGYWWPKLKIGGLMCGDDYQNKPTHGVIQAVDELFPRRKLAGPIWFVNKVTVELL